MLCGFAHRHSVVVVLVFWELKMKINHIYIKPQYTLLIITYIYTCEGKFTNNLLLNIILILESRDYDMGMHHMHRYIGDHMAI